MKNRKKIFFYLIILLGLLTYSGYYLFSKYLVLETPIDTIRIELSKTALDKGAPIMYASKDNSSKINFTDVYRFVRIDETTAEVTDLKGKHISKFRIYFEFPGKDFHLKSIALIDDFQQLIYETDDIDNNEGIAIKEKGSFEVTQHNGYIEFPYVIANKIPYLALSLCVLFLGLITILVIRYTGLLKPLQVVDKKDYLIIIYLFSIFSFAPLYNIALILCLLFYIKDFNKNIFFKNKTNILFIGFFAVYLLNTFFLKENESRDFSIIEKFLPFVFIPLLLASVKLKNALYYLLLSSLTIGLFLFLTSSIDFVLLKKYEYFSFETFSKYYHPVYLSYLVFISICFVQQYYHGKKRYLLQLILVAFLVFLGSKMVLIVGLLLFSIFFINVKKRLIYFIALVGIFMFSIFVFKPLQDRFAGVLKQDDLSILEESKIDNANDSRINGLTIRLILWRESLATMDGLKEYVFGNGVTKSKNKDLKERLMNLGLDHHAKLNPHNQFVDTFWRTGIVGLIILVTILVVAMKEGLKHGNKVLIIFTLFILFSFFTESLFGRVRGIYFTTTVLLVLTNSSYRKEFETSKDTLELNN